MRQLLLNTPVRSRSRQLLLALTVYDCHMSCFKLTRFTQSSGTIIRRPDSARSVCLFAYSGQNHSYHGNVFENQYGFIEYFTAHLGCHNRHLHLGIPFCFVLLI